MYMYMNCLFHRVLDKKSPYLSPEHTSVSFPSIASTSSYTSYAACA